MSEPFIGEIRMFAGDFAPRGWAFCDGQLLATSQNDALFSLLGTIYGGDGRTTFGLPDLRGRVPVHAGSGPALTPRPLGQKSGFETVTLTTNEMPVHNHNMNVRNEPGTSPDPSGRILAGSARVGRNSRVDTPYAGTPDTNMANDVSLVGGSQSHTNIQPFLAVHYIIALVGIFPSRN
ncbi:MAG: tail fiber protein [Bacteroidota bacterium]